MFGLCAKKVFFWQNLITEKLVAVKGPVFIPTTYRAISLIDFAKLCPGKETSCVMHFGAFIVIAFTFSIRNAGL
jgi:hypothetical protein